MNWKEAAQFTSERLQREILTRVSSILLRRFSNVNRSFGRAPKLSTKMTPCHHIAIAVIISLTALGEIRPEQPGCEVGNNKDQFEFYKEFYNNGE